MIKVVARKYYFTERRYFWHMKIKLEEDKPKNKIVFD